MASQPTFVFTETGSQLLTANEIIIVSEVS
jgi:hypothetical protein